MPVHILNQRSVSQVSVFPFLLPITELCQKQNSTSGRRSQSKAKDILK